MMNSTGSQPDGQAAAARLPRAARREQILAAATEAFARAGFAATSLDDIAEQARISKVILYRHFESKADLYLAVLDQALQRMITATGAPDFSTASVDALLAAAAQEPAGFRLLFRHAAREPQFRERTDQLRTEAYEVTHQHLAALIPDQTWARWAALVMPAIVIEAVMAWLDAGQPDPPHAAARINRLVQAVIEAAQSTP
jgi:AcrR family transcriptional regulator